jgi:tetratricopeptide (TPR) repeat protein
LAPGAAGKKRRRLLLGSSLLLGLLTVLCYWPICKNGFVVLDDPKYLLENTHIHNGLTWGGIWWAFGSGYASNWHPVTWISHMVDCQLFGLDPAGHHLANLLLHAANAVLVLLVLHAMTGALWRSTVVAALFAWHPLHVESVAWAAERKDVLSTCFFLLTLGAYARYARSAGARCGTDGRATAAFTLPGGGNLADEVTDKVADEVRRTYYVLALAFFALALMSKPMVVTVPCVLLLLDFWPLQRLAVPLPSSSSLRSRWSALRPLVWEKAPFVALSLGSCVITYIVQKSGGAVSSLGTVPLGSRVANALVAYIRYLSKTVWPADLSVFYPLPDHWPTVEVLGAALLLLGASVVLLRWSAQRSYLGVGWLWFLGTLVPVIGLIQVGSQSMADRYMYIPSLGLFMMVAWGGAELVTIWPRGRWFVLAAATAGLMVCLARTSVQLRYWHDEETLFRRAAACASDNYLAYDHLAKVCESSGRREEAVVFYVALLHLKPGYLEGQYNLGTLLLEMGRLDEAALHLQRAVALNPRFAPAHSNLGLTFFRRNQPVQAAEHLELAAKLTPQDPDAQVNCGVAQLAVNCPGEAAASFSRALLLAPDNPAPHFLLASALAQDHKPDEAFRHASRARELALGAGNQGLAAQAQSLADKCRPNTLPARESREL